MHSVFGITRSLGHLSYAAPLGSLNSSFAYGSVKEWNTVHTVDLLMRHVGDLGNIIKAPPVEYDVCKVRRNAIHGDAREPSG